MSRLGADIGTLITEPAVHPRPHRISYTSLAFQMYLSNATARSGKMRASDYYSQGLWALDDMGNRKEHEIKSLAPDTVLLTYYISLMYRYKKPAKCVS
jgi:hypothetical protein